MIMVAGAIFYLYTDPTYTVIQGNQAQIAQYNAALDKAAQLESVMKQLLAKFNAFNPSDLARLQTMLPDQVNDIALILDFDTLASKDNMSLENVDVNSNEASAVQNTSATGVVGTVNVDYNTLVMNFTVHGTYAAFEQFLSVLQSSLAIVDIQSIKVTDDTQANGGVGGTPVYSFTVALQTYWLKPSVSAIPLGTASSTSS